MNTAFGNPFTSQAPGAPPPKDRNLRIIEQLLLDLCNSDLRENTLYELSKKRDLVQDLALLLWHSFGTIALLLQELVSIYPVLSPPALTMEQSNRACNALNMLQCVAAHPDTRILFVQAHIPLYLYPFLNNTTKTKPYEYLRLTSLGVIGALVKVDNREIVKFLLSTEIVPLCLRTMDVSNEISRTVESTGYLEVATYIIFKILLDDFGLAYMCTTADRFFALGKVLGEMVTSRTNRPGSRLLKHIIHCYLRLSENLRGCEALASCLPGMLTDGSFTDYYNADRAMWNELQKLLNNIQAAV